MALAPGSRLGAYEILTLLGSGGMGEVYRARDTKLDREVAIKILPELFVSDPERIARFQREAKTLATLNHPHIGSIYGLEDAEGVRALVLELVEGPTLADRIAQGPIPLEEALPIARQIAQALEAAHEQGIVHRDLKPANIKVRNDGTVKVLDFGLAKLASDGSSASGRPGGLTQSPTLTSPVATLAGTILGTAAYMAPEQARGKPVDKRADIWAFGCVLFEMMTGKRAFGSDEVSDTLAFIITKDVEWRALAATTPIAIRRVLRRCLEKDPAKRLHDIADARLEIDEAIANPEATAAASGPENIATSPAGRFRWIMPSVAAAVVAGALVSAIVWVSMRTAAVPRAEPMRFAIATDPAQALGGNPIDRSVAISADGMRVAYIGGRGEVFVRSIDQLEAVAIPGIAGARTPFFSPDGKWIGFFTIGEMRKVAIQGGPATSICRVTAAPRGATWAPNDTIVFATGNTGLMSVAASGGEPKVLTTADNAHGEFGHFYPSALPDGRHVLYTVLRNGGAENAQIAVLDLPTRQSKTLIRGGTQAEYAPSGHLVYTYANGISSGPATLRAVRFDLQQLEVTGDPVPVLDRITLGQFGSANFAISRNGTLVYAVGDVQGQGFGPHVLVWVDRLGREEPLALPPRAYMMPRLSPDGTRVALDIRDQENDIWIFDLRRQTLERRTFAPEVDQYPVWTPDGKRIVFASTRAGKQAIYAVQADGAGTPDQLSDGSSNPLFPSSISPDGSRLIAREASPTSRFDVVMLALGGQSRTEPLLHSAYAENNGEVSPDGHWLAYQSDESNRDEIYVVPFPDVKGGKWQISTAGGTRPLWARSGLELFFLDANNLLNAVSVTTSPTFSSGNAIKVLNTPYFVSSAISGRSYDVSPDGKRFLTIKEASGDRKSTGAPPMVLVLNWTEELKQRVPTK